MYNFSLSHVTIPHLYPLGDSNMQLEIKKWGNSAGLALSKPLLEQINSGIGSMVEVEVRDGMLLIKPVRETPSLEQLLAGSPRELLSISEEDQAWEQASSMGREEL